MTMGVLFRGTIGLACLLVFSYAISPPNRIHFRGKDLFLSGINVPWGPVSFSQDINFLDPLCHSPQCEEDRTYFDNMFATINSYGGNSIRFWLHPDGGPLPVVNNDFTTRLIDEPSSTQIASIQYVLDLGKKYDILVDLCLWSFDMVNDWEYGPNYGLWNKMLTNDTNLNSYLNNWLLPVLTQIGYHPNLLSLEVFNEPEGMMNEGTTYEWGWTACNSNSTDCSRVSILTAQKFANKIASFIHNFNSELLVTVGSWSYHASGNINGDTNIWCDKCLINAGGEVNGVLDYYQIHYYNWAAPGYSPFQHPASYWNVFDKAHVIGEFPNNPIPFTSNSTSQGDYCYEKLYQSGYSGAWGWGFNSGDGNADFDKQPFLDNMRYMQEKYGRFQWPQGKF